MQVIVHKTRGVQEVIEHKVKKWLLETFEGLSEPLEIKLLLKSAILSSEKSLQDCGVTGDANLEALFISAEEQTAAEPDS